MIPWLRPGSEEPFPAPPTALREPNGLLAAGADLSPRRLLQAYDMGVFPWYSPGEPILWWSPDPRLVIDPAVAHVSRRMRRTLRQAWGITVDGAFERVIAACAAPRDGQHGTWITDDMALAYVELHEAGHAHSLEVWWDSKLVGGIYGICRGQVFFGESMFHRRRDASKVALLCLCQWLSHHGITLLDCQVDSPHLRQFGAGLMPRAEFLTAVAQRVHQPGPIGDWQRLARPVQWAPFFSAP